MKKSFVFIVALLLLLTACQPTPEVEVIPNKGEAKKWQVEAKPYVPEEQPEPAAAVEAPAEIEQ